MKKGPQAVSYELLLRHTKLSDSLVHPLLTCHQIQLIVFQLLGYYVKRHNYFSGQTALLQLTAHYKT